jgi:hypothetical protein
MRKKKKLYFKALKGIVNPPLVLILITYTPPFISQSWKIIYD